MQFGASKCGEVECFNLKLGIFSKSDVVGAECYYSIIEIDCLYLANDSDGRLSSIMNPMKPFLKTISVSQYLHVTK